MSNIIDFLENVGQNASLRYASAGDMQRMLADIQVDPDVRDAVLAKDQARLTALVGAQNVCCYLVPAQTPYMLIPGVNEEDEFHYARCA